MSGIYQDMYEEERAIAQEKAEDHARELDREFPSDTPLERLYDAAHELELSLSSYSGRGMYGRLCPSISARTRWPSSRKPPRGACVAQGPTVWAWAAWCTDLRSSGTRHIRHRTTKSGIKLERDREGIYSKIASLSYFSRRNGKIYYAAHQIHYRPGRSRHCGRLERGGSRRTSAPLRANGLVLRRGAVRRLHLPARE